MSDTNATNKVAKEHTNVNASQTDKVQPPFDRFNEDAHKHHLPL